MRSRRSRTGIGRNRCQNVRGEGVPVPPENGFQVKICLWYSNRELKFAVLLRASGEKRCFGAHRAAPGNRRHYECVGHVFLLRTAYWDVSECTPRVPAAAWNSLGAGARKPPKIHIFVFLYIDTMMMLVLVVLIHLLIKGC